ncbi:hypothetical protein ACFOZ5_11385 [Marinobacter lacisalsi]|uniref:Uncharacterized protein n=1 Tax=Marinobacter lacisalsi TaxID=475979 RepID=A0ABV8QJS0_9GAMM
MHKAAQAVDARNKKREADKEEQQRRALIAMSELAEVQSDNLIKLRQQVESDSVQAGINFDKSHRLERRVYILNWVIVSVSIVTGLIAAAGVWVTMQSGTDISPEIEALTESVVELRGSVSELERKIGQLSPADSEAISAPAQPQPAPAPADAPSDSAPSSSHQRGP